MITLKNLSVGYNGKSVASGIDAEIDEGDFVCVVGPNGAGKSTLIKTILGTSKPISGEVRLNGIERSQIGFIAQEFAASADFPATVEEIVLSGTLNQIGWWGFYTASCREKTTEAMKKMGLTKLRKKSFFDLSGGQKQKVLLARALAATSRLLILDEPSNNLDRKSIKDLYETLMKLNQAGITIIMITQDLDHGNRIGNKILSLNDEVFYGTVDEFVRRVHHE